MRGLGKAPPYTPYFLLFYPSTTHIASSDSRPIFELLTFNMLDLNDFIAERGGDPKKIKESQRKRFAPEEAVDEVIALYEEARAGRDAVCVMVK